MSVITYWVTNHPLMTLVYWCGLSVLFGLFVSSFVRKGN